MRNGATRPQPSVERLESRALLTTTGVLAGTELSVFADEGDDIVVQHDATTGNIQVLANGQIATGVPSVASSTLTALNIIAGNDNNVIDVSAVLAVDFTSLPLTGSVRIEAGDGNDSVTGSGDFGESILGQDGDDTIDGGDGADTIDGGDGDDLVTGGSGNDSITGDDGADTITGGDGDDIIISGDGADSVTGNAGMDNIDVGQGADFVDGGDDNDTINGMAGNDTINGGAGSDSVLGGTHHDVINGGDGNDTLNGQGGNDTIDGLAGDDSLLGSSGRDSIRGGDGDDFLNGNGGSDTLSGDVGDDRIFGGSQNDSLLGGEGDDVVSGQGGADTIDGQAGSDTLNGGSGDDLVAEPQLPPLQPLISVMGATSSEGTSGSQTATFTVSLSQPSMSVVTVEFSTSDGTATAADGDFNAAAGTLSFLPGEVIKTVDVTINGDSRAEIDETFQLHLSSPTNGALDVPEAFITILDSSGLPPARLIGSDLDGRLYDVDPFTAASTLIGGTGLRRFQGLTSDPSGTIFATVDPNVRLFTIDVPTANANLVATLAPQPTPIFEGDITYNDSSGLIYAIFSGNGPQLYTINPATGATTNLGQFLQGGSPLSTGTSVEINALEFRGDRLYTVISSGLTGVSAPLTDVLLEVDLATMNVTPVGGIVGAFSAAAGMTYDPIHDVFYAASGSRTVPGRLYKINPDTGGSILVGTTSVTDITGLLLEPGNDPIAPPTLSASDVVVTEGDGAAVVASFDVTLSHECPVPITVDYQTVNGSGVTIDDFSGATGSVTFMPGDTSQTVTVMVTGDDLPERSETFFLELLNPAGASLAKAFGIATVIDDDVDTQPNTLLGGNGNDTLRAGPGDDFLNGGDGNEEISAGEGNDVVLGGADRDTIDGGAGDDTIDGQGGDDVIQTGRGQDVVIWNGSGDGVDAVQSSDGAQELRVMGDGGADSFAVDSNGGLLRVTEGVASITVSDVTSTVSVLGGNGNDSITINSIDDIRPVNLTVDGQGGNDTISALNARLGTVRLTIRGGDGNDTVTGSRDTDSIVGDAGDDSVSGGEGADIVDGGAGNDVVNGGTGNDTLDGGAGNDTVNGNEDDDSLVGGFGHDVLMGDAGNDSLRGGFGNDSLNGGSGNDLADGNQDDDRVLGGAGEDSLDGGTGDDTVRGQADNDQLKGGDGNDSIEGNSGADTIDGGDGNDTILAGNGNDIIDGGDGHDSVNGMAGRDTLIGSDGNDTLLGGGGVDRLYGGDGADTLRGNGSTDRFNSGEGGQAPQDLAMGEMDDQNLTIELSVLAALAELNGF